jgi:hypothetical protein
MSGFDWLYVGATVALGLLDFLWQNRLGIAALLGLIFLAKILNRLVVLDSMAGSIKRIREMLERKESEELSTERKRDLRHRAGAGSWAASQLLWIEEYPEEHYRWIHKVPTDACAIRCPYDRRECWQTHCVQLGECGFLREHNHATDEGAAGCEVCQFYRHATIRYRDSLSRGKEENS